MSSKFIISLQADKGNQVQAQPQAFFLPLGEAGEEGGRPVIVNVDNLENVDNAIG